MKYLLTMFMLFATLLLAIPVKSAVLEDVNAEFKIDSDWSLGFNASIVLTNTSNKNINGWFVQFDLPNEISDVWNGELVSHKGNTYVFKNKNYNSILKPNRPISFGIQGTPGNVTIPANIIVKDSIEPEPEEINCRVDFKVTEDWSSAFNGKMTITNNGTEDITGWILDFDFKHKITHIWDATIKADEKNGKYYHYKIANMDYNVIIPAGKSISFGFTAKPGNNIYDPFNIKINGKDPSGDESETVILVYRTLVRAYVHRKVGDAWKYEGDESKLTYYDVIEFTPSTRLYKQAKRIIVNFDNSITTADGLNFVEFNKEPRSGESDAYMKYLVGSTFESDSKEYGAGEAMYGKIVLAQKSNIGWKEKVALAKTMTGKFNLNSKFTWKNCNYYTRLDSKYTKDANENKRSADETVNAIINSLK